jgi:hypothetical protein
MIGSSPRARGRRNMTLSSPPNQPTKGSTSIGTVRDNDHSDDSAYDAHLAWGNIRRREKFAASKAAIGPVLKIAIPQIQGAIVTGYHGVGFCPWPEDNQARLSKTINKIWREMAQKQYMTGRDKSNAIDMEPKDYEARKVQFRSSSENKDADAIIDV